MEREVLLEQLPKYQHKLKMVTPRQTVSKIRNLLLQKHEDNAEMYDAIAGQFSRRSVRNTCEDLWTWLKENIQYVEETEERQIIKTPQAIIETGVSDCKGFASFVGGVLDALKRKGKPLQWRYVFAGYGDTNHVFVEVDIGAAQYWIDPVLKSFDQREPKPITVKKFERDMALYTLSGIPKTGCAGCAGKMGITMAQAEECILPYESIDQQLIRLTGCQSGGGGQIIPFNPASDFYDLPVNTGLPLTSPVDATPLDPGNPVTMNPSPAPSPAPVPPVSDSGIMGWISENPLLAAAIAAGTVYLFSRKKRRRA